MGSDTTRIGIAVVEHENRFLVGQRGDDSPLRGKAEFPGGKCLPEESPADCAVRECFEETGLEVQAVRLLETRVHDYPHGRVELLFWLCKPADPETVKGDHQGFGWIPREALKTLDFPEANRRVVEWLSKTVQNRVPGEPRSLDD